VMRSCLADCQAPLASIQFATTLGLTYRGHPLREPLAYSWDKRRPLPRFATDYCKMLAAYMREMSDKSAN
jgi:hypothetical protein